MPDADGRPNEAIQRDCDCSRRASRGFAVDVALAAGLRGPRARGLLGHVCSAKPPYAVISASADWLQLCGFVEHEVIGKTLALIQGPASNQSDLRTMGWLAYVRGGGA